MQIFACSTSFTQKQQKLLERRYFIFEPHIMSIQRVKCALALVFVALFSFSGLQAQSYKSRHPFDFKSFNLGFLMALNYNAYNLKEQINVVDNGIRLKHIEVVPRPGLSLGMITNFNLHKNISFRFIPTISLEQRNFDYHFATRNEAIDSLGEVRKIEASYLNLPFLFQFKSNYYKNTRMYVLSGMQLGLNLASNKKVRDDPTLLKITTQDVSAVFGFGMNLYGDRIKLSPEIRYSVGLFNIYEPGYTTHSAAISRLSSQVLMLIVNFE